MTPEQHWAEAERLLDEQSPWSGQRAEDLARAEVHATLALAGATLLAGAAGYDTARDRLADAVLGVQR